MAQCGPSAPLNPFSASSGKLLPRTHESDIIKLVVFVAILAGMGLLARMGLLPRTRAIVPGEWAISD